MPWTASATQPCTTPCRRASRRAPPFWCAPLGAPLAALLRTWREARAVEYKCGHRASTSTPPPPLPLPLQVRVAAASVAARTSRGATPIHLAAAGPNPAECLKARTGAWLGARAHPARKHLAAARRRIFRAAASPSLPARAALRRPCRCSCLPPGPTCMPSTAAACRRCMWQLRRGLPPRCGRCWMRGQIRRRPPATAAWPGSWLRSTPLWLLACRSWRSSRQRGAAAQLRRWRQRRQRCACRRCRRRRWSPRCCRARRRRCLCARPRCSQVGMRCEFAALTSLACGRGTTHSPPGQRTTHLQPLVAAREPESELARAGPSLSAPSAVFCHPPPAVPLAAWPGEGKHSWQDGCGAAAAGTDCQQREQQQQQQQQREPLPAPCTPPARAAVQPAARASPVPQPASCTGRECSICMERANLVVRRAGRAGA